MTILLNLSIIAALLIMSLVVRLRILKRKTLLRIKRKINRKKLLRIKRLISFQRVWVMVTEADV